MESETTDLIASLSMRSLCIGLTDGQLARLAGAGSVEHFEAGQVITSGRRPGQALYTILTGSVCVSSPGLHGGGQKEAAVLRGEGTPSTPYDRDFFGETSILDFEPINATITAREWCDLLVIPVPRLYEVFQQDRDIHIIVISNLARALRRRLKPAGEGCDGAGPCHCGGPKARGAC